MGAQNRTKNHRTTITVATTAAAASTTNTTTEATTVLVAADAADANNKRNHCEDNQTDTNNKSKRIRTVVDQDDMRTCAVCGIRSGLFSKRQLKKKEAAFARCFDCAETCNEEHQAEGKRRKEHKKTMAAVRRRATNEVDEKEEKKKLDQKKATKHARNKR